MAVHSRKFAPDPAKTWNYARGNGSCNQMITVQDTQATPRQGRSRDTLHLSHINEQFRASVMNQSRRNRWLDMLEFIVKRLPGCRERVSVVLIPGTHGRLRLEDHRVHDLNALGKGDLQRVLRDGMIDKHLLHPLRMKNSLQGSPNHHAYRARIHERFELATEQHPCCLLLSAAPRLGFVERRT